MMAMYQQRELIYYLNWENLVFKTYFKLPQCEMKYQLILEYQLNVLMDLVNKYLNEIKCNSKM